MTNCQVFVAVLMRVPPSWMARVALAAFNVTPAAVPTVNDPAVPMLMRCTRVPSGEPQVVLVGIVTVPPELLFRVTRFPASAVPRVRAVVVSVLMKAPLMVSVRSAAVSTSPVVKVDLIAMVSSQNPSWLISSTPKSLELSTKPVIASEVRNEIRC